MLEGLLHVFGPYYIWLVILFLCGIAFAAGMMFERWFASWGTQ